MKFLKIDPITGVKVATGACPDDEPLPEIDHEGLLVFAIEGEPHEYSLDQQTMTLIRTDQAAIAELRRLLAAEKRPPTPEELATLGLGGNA